MDLEGWLRSLGLEQYEAVFRENEIERASYRTSRKIISASLGLPLGVRLKFLRAIATLALNAMACPETAARAGAPPTEFRVERRTGKGT
jgi:hypothetical protein